MLLGILVPVCFSTRLGVSLAAPKGVSKWMGIKMASFLSCEKVAFGCPFVLVPVWVPPRKSNITLQCKFTRTASLEWGSRAFLMLGALPCISRRTTFLNSLGVTKRPNIKTSGGWSKGVRGRGGGLFLANSPESIYFYGLFPLPTYVCQLMLAFLLTILKFRT